MDERPPAIFVGDATGLDFLNSIATPVDTPIDWIDDGEGYLSWLEQARLVPDDVLRDMRARALPGELDKIADQARSLREWFRGFVRRHKGRPLTAEASRGTGAAQSSARAGRELQPDRLRPGGGRGLSSFRSVRRWRASGARCCFLSARRWRGLSAARIFPM